MLVIPAGHLLYPSFQHAVSWNPFNLDASLRWHDGKVGPVCARMTNDVTKYPLFQTKCSSFQPVIFFIRHSSMLLAGIHLIWMPAYAGMTEKWDQSALA